MNFFNNNKLKAKTNIELDRVNFCINYYNIKESDKLKLTLIKKIMKQNYCLVTIDTTMLYKNDIKDTETMMESLVGELEKLKVAYCKKANISNSDTKILGVRVNMDGKKKQKDYIIGFTINSEKLDVIQTIMKNPSFHYYLVKDELTEEELLNKFELNYFNEEELKLYFQYDVFDSSFIKQLVITSSKENLSFINKIIEETNRV